MSTVNCATSLLVPYVPALTPVVLKAPSRFTVLPAPVKVSESATKSPLALFKFTVTALVKAFAKSDVPETLPVTLPVKLVALIS